MLEQARFSTSGFESALRTQSMWWRRLSQVHPTPARRWQAWYLQMMKNLRSNESYSTANLPICHSHGNQGIPFFIRQFLEDRVWQEDDVLEAFPWRRTKHCVITYQLQKLMQHSSPSDRRRHIISLNLTAQPKNSWEDLIYSPPDRSVTKLYL